MLFALGLLILSYLHVLSCAPDEEVKKEGTGQSKKEVESLEVEEKGVVEEEGKGE